MGRFENGTYVEVIATGRRGIVYDRNRNKVAVEFYDSGIFETETLTFNDHELKVVVMPRIKTSQLRGLVTGELEIGDITEGFYIFDDVLETDSKAYAITVADLFAGIEKMKESKDFTKIYQWLVILNRFDEEMGFGYYSDDVIKDAITEGDILDYAEGYLCSLYWDFGDYEDDDYIIKELNSLYETFKAWIDSDGREYPDDIARLVMINYDDDSIDKESEATQALFKECVDRLCEKKEPKAIQKRGYCYYVGCKPYPNDWVKARDAFIEYYNMTGDASAANTLGYIYYYGRCNGGEPEYEEAFKYFSIGHAYTYFESTYKLADMFAHGWGVVKDPDTANYLYWSVYNQNIDRFRNEDYGGKFADAALRIGNCYKEGIGESVDFKVAYYYYLQADFAIRERTKRYNHYGDSVVFNGVQKALGEVRKEYTEHGRTEQYVYPSWIRFALIGHRRAKIKIKELTNGPLALDVSPMKRYDDKVVPKMLITIPKADYCELKSKIRIKTALNSSYKVNGASGEIIFDHVEYDWKTNKTIFYLNEDITGEIVTAEYTFTAPAKKKVKKTGRVYHFASIVFDKNGRCYDYLCDDESVKVGDWVIVNGYDGEKKVQVVDVTDKDESELGLEIEKYKKIVRKADCL